MSDIYDFDLSDLMSDEGDPDAEMQINIRDSEEDMERLESEVGARLRD